MRLKSLKNILLKNETYVDLRYSSFFLRLWLFFNPSVKIKLKKQNDYYSDFLKNLKTGSHIAFDIGANEGFVSEVFLERNLEVVAVEPDARNTAILTSRFVKNPKFHLLSCAAGGSLGTEKLYSQKDGTAFSTINPKWKELIEKGDYRFHFLYESETRPVQLITLDQLIQSHGIPSFIKIDVERNESEVMKGISQKIPLLVFEANLPEFINETFDCLEHLYHIDKKIVFNYSSAFTYGADQFFGYEDFKHVLSSLDHRCVDIICIMSNYFDYYHKLPINK